MAAFYSLSLEKHNSISDSEIIGKLSQEYSQRYQNQKKDLTRSWGLTIPIVRRLYQDNAGRIADLDEWYVLYEYSIPRRSKRIDVVLLSPRAIYVIECKIGSAEYSPADERQLKDYCLDLRDFHLESARRTIVPILLCSEAPPRPTDFGCISTKLHNTQFANAYNLGEIVSQADLNFRSLPSDLDAVAWDNSEYMPTPTIIEAARTIYADKTVSAIARNQAGEDNLGRTQAAVLDAIKDARANGSKAICFITGVPGAGKTLAGLNIVHGRDFQDEDKDLGIFLSGNSPLVKVLSEALAVDLAQREGGNRTEARRQVSTFITNVHSFIDEYFGDPVKDEKLPPENVLVYDEAQRAWTAEHKARKSYGAIKQSEPDILLSIMNRFSGWAVIICLVGGGQEINTGEAGLREWGRSLKSEHSSWKIYVSPSLKQGDHTTGHTTLFDSLPDGLNIVEDERLHLTVGIRAPRAKAVSEWVASVLESDVQDASRLLREDLQRYPIVITRDLQLARRWLREKAAYDARTGIVASSGGRRLRAEGLDPSNGLRGDSDQGVLGAWYLNSPNDVRSSNFLEVVSTEYGIQGLEIDWAGVLWDADLRMTQDGWQCRSFIGTRWQKVDEQQKQYTLNKYRVLLTRARDGMVIFVPKGDSMDATRDPQFYDGTFEYLKGLGIPDAQVDLEE